MTDLEDYRNRVRAAASSAARYLPPHVMLEVDELIDHGEPAEGLCSLAWAIVNARVRVPRQLIDAIYEYTSELVDSKHLPPDLGDYAERDR